MDITLAIMNNPTLSKEAKERSIKKPHPKCEEATGLGVRGGSVQKHKSECGC
jgi:hypothetical protein